MIELAFNGTLSFFLWNAFFSFFLEIEQQSAKISAIECVIQSDIFLIKRRFSVRYSSLSEICLQCLLQNTFCWRKDLLWIFNYIFKLNIAVLNWKKNPLKRYLARDVWRFSFKNFQKTFYPKNNNSEVDIFFKHFLFKTKHSCTFVI